MSLWQHYDKVITRMHADICRLIEEKAEIEACVEDLIAIRDQARAIRRRRLRWWTLSPAIAIIQIYSPSRPFRVSGACCKPHSSDS